MLATKMKTKAMVLKRKVIRNYLESLFKNANSSTSSPEILTQQVWVEVGQLYFQQASDSAAGGGRPREVTSPEFLLLGHKVWVTALLGAAGPLSGPALPTQPLDSQDQELRIQMSFLEHWYSGWSLTGPVTLRAEASFLTTSVFASPGQLANWSSLPRQLYQHPPSQRLERNKFSPPLTPRLSPAVSEISI